jgi:hypothetical protein
MFMLALNSNAFIITIIKITIKIIILLSHVTTRGLLRFRAVFSAVFLFFSAT